MRLHAETARNKYLTARTHPPSARARAFPRPPTLCSRDAVSYEAWFVFGVVLWLLELSLLFACMLGVRRVCVKLGADPRDPVKTMDTVLEKIWVAPV